MEIHILEVRSDRADAIFHIPVPNVLNTAGISYRTALKEYRTGTDIAVPGLDVSDPAEYAAIGNGEVYEYKTMVEYSANLSNAQKKQAIENEYIAKKDTILSVIQARLEFWQMAWNTEV